MRLLLAQGGVILLAGMLIIGTWVSKEIERGHIDQVGFLTSLYMESFVAPHVQSLRGGSPLSAGDRVALDGLLSETPLGRQVVAFKIWAADGTLLYSTNPALIGRKFEVRPKLASALANKIHSEITDLSDPDNEFERTHWSRLIETYAPLRAQG
ncbi:MAG: sensor histidine kinase, partial [Pseudomonadota bacterium]